MTIVLQGLTWDDPRGYGPLPEVDAAFARQYPQQVSVQWDVQPLGGFESASLVELASRYDLLVLDHPHIGEADACGALLPLGCLHESYIGLTHESYTWNGLQWAVPIDAACHVAAFRQDSTLRPLRDWNAVFAAAEDGLQLATPLGGVHALMALLTLLASQGAVVEDATGGQLPYATELTRAASRLQRLARLGPAEALQWNPLDALRALAARRCDYVPLTFGYAHFQAEGVYFAPVPAIGARRPRAVLGGAGLAVSARCAHAEQARAYARFCGSRAVQMKLWPSTGGQPAHTAAWDMLGRRNAFYRDTRAAMENAFVRPRFAGWSKLQSRAGQAIHDWLCADCEPPEVVAEQLHELWKPAPVHLLPQESLA